MATTMFNVTNVPQDLVKTELKELLCFVYSINYNN